MKKLLLSLCFVAVSGFYCLGQEVLLDVSTASDTLREEKGPNRSKFSHLYFGFGMAATGAEGDSLKTLYGASNEMTFGYRFKKRLSKAESLGFDLYYTVRNTGIDQTADKKFLTSFAYDRERFSSRNLGISLYNRINFGKRGNTMGKFLDVAGYFEWPFQNTVTVWQDISAKGYGAARITYSKLKIQNPYNYGAQARLGFGRWVFYANYRVSQMFKSKFGFAEFPRLTAGVQVGLHR